MESTVGCKLFDSMRSRHELLHIDQGKNAALFHAGGSNDIIMCLEERRFQAVPSKLNKRIE